MYLSNQQTANSFFDRIEQALRIVVIDLNNAHSILDETFQTLSTRKRKKQSTESKLRLTFRSIYQIAYKTGLKIFSNNCVQFKQKKNANPHSWNCYCIEIGAYIFVCKRIKSVVVSLNLEMQYDERVWNKWHHESQYLWIENWLMNNCRLVASTGS